MLGTSSERTPNVITPPFFETGFGNQPQDSFFLFI
jgi:hypothetical protein